MKLAWLPMLILLPTACGGDVDGDATSTGDTGASASERVYDGVGDACLMSSDQVDLSDLGYGYDTDTLVADAAPAVVVMFSTCISGSAYEVTAQCEVTLDGAALQVTGTARYLVPPTSVSDCNWLYAWCDAPVLAAGSYTLEYGGVSAPVTIPSSGPPPCTGSLF